MGLRYRKSINWGGGFRTNFSKSGIGCSWGFKGYRITLKAGGGFRTTSSIPGTGLSWVEDFGGGKRIPRGKGAGKSIVSNAGDILYQAEGANVKLLVSENTQDFLHEIKKYSGIRTALIWVCILSILFATKVPLLLLVFLIGVVGLVYLSIAKKIIVEYDCDDYGNRRIQMMNQAMHLLLSNGGIWQVNRIQANSSLKMHGGARSSVTLKTVEFKEKKPYFLKTDATCYYIKLKQCQIYILPDRLIIKGKKGWGAVDYSELHIDVDDINFVVSGKVPKDAQIVEHTWQFVNKDGSPDRRFKSNRRLPVCNYGSLMFTSNTTLNVILYVSNVDNAKQFAAIVQTMKLEAEKVQKVQH